MALAVPTSAFAGEGPAPLDLRLQADDGWDEGDDGGAPGTTQAHIRRIGGDVERLHRNAKMRYWIGFPSLFLGITIWTGGGPGFVSPNLSIGAAIGLGTGAFVTGVIMLDKANQYDRAATRLIRGTARLDPRRERRRLHGFVWSTPTVGHGAR